MLQQRRDCILDIQPQWAQLRRALGASFIAIFEQQRIEIWIGTGYLRSFDPFRKRDLVNETTEYDRAAKILLDLLQFVGAKMRERHALRPYLLARQLSARAQQRRHEEFNLMPVRMAPPLNMKSACLFGFRRDSSDALLRCVSRCSAQFFAAHRKAGRKKPPHNTEARFRGAQTLEQDETRAIRHQAPWRPGPGI